MSRLTPGWGGWPGAEILGAARAPMEMERVIYGQVDGDRSPPRFVASTVSLLPDGLEKLLLPRKVEFGRRASCWRRDGARSLAISLQPGRDTESVFTPGIVESHALVWTRTRGPEDHRVALRAAWLLHHADAREAEDDWWPHRDNPNWERPSFRIRLPLVGDATRSPSDEDLGRVMQLGLDGLSELARDSGGRKALVRLYCRLAAREQDAVLARRAPGVLSGLERPLAPASLAALLLPLPPDMAARMSLMGWVLADAEDPGWLANQWDIVVCGETRGLDLTPDAAAELAHRSWAEGVVDALAAGKPDGLAMRLPTRRAGGRGRALPEIAEADPVTEPPAPEAPLPAPAGVAPVLPKPRQPSADGGGPARASVVAATGKGSASPKTAPRQPMDRIPSSDLAVLPDHEAERLRTVLGDKVLKPFLLKLPSGRWAAFIAEQGDVQGFQRLLDRDPRSLLLLQKLPGWSLVVRRVFARAMGHGGRPYRVLRVVEKWRAWAGEQGSAQLPLEWLEALLEEGADLSLVTLDADLTTFMLAKAPALTWLDKLLRCGCAPQAVGALLAGDLPPTVVSALSHSLTPAGGTGPLPPTRFLARDSAYIRQVPIDQARLAAQVLQLALDIAESRTGRDRESRLRTDSLRAAAVALVPAGADLPRLLASPAGHDSFLVHPLAYVPWLQADDRKALARCVRPLELERLVRKATERNMMSSRTFPAPKSWLDELQRESRASVAQDDGSELMLLPDLRDLTPVPTATAEAPPVTEPPSPAPAAAPPAAKAPPSSSPDAPAPTREADVHVLRLAPDEEAAPKGQPQQPAARLPRIGPRAPRASGRSSGAPSGTLAPAPSDHTLAVLEGLLHQVRRLPDDPRAARLECHKLEGSLIQAPLEEETRRELFYIGRVLTRAFYDEES